MRLSHLNSLRALEAALRHGSFRGAAEELGVTASAVGQRIAQLEAALGQTLFERHVSGARPTAAARAVAGDLTSGFARLASAHERLSAPPDVQRLAMSTTPAFAEVWLPPLLPEFLEREGPVDLRLEAGPQQVDLHEGSFDFAIREGVEAPPEMAARPLFPVVQTPVCTPGFARRYGLTRQTRDLSHVPLFHSVIPGAVTGLLDWAAWSRETGIPISGEGPSRFTGYSSGIRIALSGLALYLASPVLVAHAFRDGLLVAPLGPEVACPSPWTSRLIWPRTRRLPPLHRRFRDWITEKAREDRAAMSADYGPLSPPPARPEAD